jgi:hypothetical protein
MTIQAANPYGESLGLIKKDRTEYENIFTFLHCAPSNMVHRIEHATS